MLIRLYIHYSRFRICCYLSLTGVSKRLFFLHNRPDQPSATSLSSAMDIGFFPGGTEGGKTVGYGLDIPIHLSPK